MPLTIFISYSHETPEQSERVGQFAGRLKAANVDVILDQWAQPERGWALWSEQQIRGADFVLIVCTEKYRQLAESPEQQEDSGYGTCWEADLIRQRLYDAKGANRRFIPVFFGRPVLENVPDFLRSAMRYQIDDLNSYRELTRRLGVLADRAAASKQLAPLAECDEKGLRSLAGDVPTSIRFDNQRADNVLLYWIDYDGKRVFYSEIKPRESITQSTYVTHPWIVTARDAQSGTERCLAVFQPEPEPGIAEIH